MNLSEFKRKVRRMDPVELIQCEATESSWLANVNLEIAKAEDITVKEELISERAVLVKRLSLMREVLPRVQVNRPRPQIARSALGRASSLSKWIEK